MRIGRILGAWACALASAGAAVLPLSGQVPSGYARSAVSVHPHGTMVAVSLRLPAGSAQDAPGLEGTAFLLAETMKARADERLDPQVAVLSTRVEPAHTTFTLLSLPEEWRQAWAAVEAILFDLPVDESHFEAERSELQAVLAFESGSPVRRFQMEAAATLVEAGSAWSRPTRGSLESVGRIRHADAARFRAAHYTRGGAAIALVGPLAGEAGSVDGATPLPDGRPGGMAWTAGERIVLTQEVTSTWISVAYPAPAELSRTTLELVAHLVLEELDPVPPAPDRYGVDVRLVDTPGGPVLLVEAAVLPEAADRWEARIAEVVRGLAHRPMADDFFRWKRRRFRTVRLLDEARPEIEAERITRDLALLGAPRALGADIWSLGPGQLQQAAASLGEPRILRYGPDLADRDVWGR